MLVRGICCILPSIPNRTENINIYQIVGRFLEHSRVYQFGRDLDAKLYISSADFMTRNIRNRMEVAVPIYDDEVKKRILDYLDLMFSDDVKIRKLLANSQYTKVQNVNNIDAQDRLIERAKKRNIDIEEERNAQKVARRNRAKRNREPMSEDRKKLVSEKSYLQRILDIFRRK